MNGKLLKKYVCLVLACSFVLACASFSFASDEADTLNYVCIGNSASCGFAMKEYMTDFFDDENNVTQLGYRLECSDLYAYLFGDYLKANLSTVSAVLGNEYNEVNVSQLGYVGARVQD